MFSSLRAALVLCVSAALVPVVRTSIQGEENQVEAEKTTFELQAKLADDIQRAQTALQIWLGDQVGLGRAVIWIFSWALVLKIEISKNV